MFEYKSNSSNFGNRANCLGMGPVKSLPLICSFFNAFNCNISGTILDPQKVAQARAEEIAYAERKSVWKKISRAEARRKGIGIIKLRCIEINKSDCENEGYTSIEAFG